MVGLGPMKKWFSCSVGERSFGAGRMEMFITLICFVVPAKGGGSFRDCRCGLGR